MDGALLMCRVPCLHAIARTRATLNHEVSDCPVMFSTNCPKWAATEIPGARAGWAPDTSSTAASITSIARCPRSEAGTPL